MATEFTIENQEMNDLFKEMVDDAIAFAVVAKDGMVGFHYAKHGSINTDPKAASTIISTVARLLSQHDKGS